MHEPNLNLIDDLFEKMNSSACTDAEWRDCMFQCAEEFDPGIIRRTRFRRWYQSCTFVRWHLGIWVPPEDE